MIKISHRGNVNGRIPHLENTHEYIQKALDSKYDVEIDVWVKDEKLWLGHDKPEISTSLEWLEDRADRLWIHCKNFKALSLFSRMNSGISPWNFFFHEKEKFTIISNGMIWAHQIADANDLCIIPLLSKKELINWNVGKVAGVCSDYVELL